MNRLEQQAFDKQKETLLANLDFTNVPQHLYAKRKLSESDLDILKQQQTGFDKRKLLLDVLETHDDGWKLLIAVLKEARQKWLADRLEEELKKQEDIKASTNSNCREANRIYSDLIALSKMRCISFDQQWNELLKGYKISHDFVPVFLDDEDNSDPDRFTFEELVKENTFIEKGDDFRYLFDDDTTPKTTYIFAQSGMGKTTFAMKILSQFYRVGQKSFVKIQRARAQQRLHVEA